VLADHVARHGWGRQLHAVTRSALRILRATQDTPGAPIPATDVEALTQLAFNNVRAVTKILTAAGMLCEDRESALDAWFTRRASGLPEPMAAEFRSWFEALRDGSRTPPWLRPGNTATIRVHVARAAPILHAWASEGRQSLREITRQDILGALPAQANQHRQALTALRSLFGSSRAAASSSPTRPARLRHDRLHNSQPLPVNLDTVRDAIHNGPPARAAFAALVAFHALRSGQLASLTLTDIRDGRLHLDGRVIPLAGPVRERLAAWLDERARHWPATANQHLFINWYTAVRESPASIPGSRTPSASRPRPSARTASWTRPWPPAETSAASATFSALPSAAPSGTPAHSRRASSDTRSQAVSRKGRLSA
jgi:integrase